MSTISPRRALIQRLLLGTVILTALVTGTICVNNAQDSAVAALTISVHHKQQEVQMIIAASPERVALIAAVNAQIAASTGKVLDPTIITAAKTQTAKSSVIVSEAGKVAMRARANISAQVAASGNAFPATITDHAASINRINMKPSIKALMASDTDLMVTIASLNAGVHDWVVEQARIAAATKVAEEKAASAATVQAGLVKQPIPRAAAPISHAPASATVTSGSKMETAQAVFTRFGFSRVNYNSSLGASHYSATDLDSQIIYVHLDNIPADRVASTCIHEYMHILQAREYGGYAATVSHFGSVLGMEQAADRAAQANGATWTRYI